MFSIHFTRFLNGKISNTRYSSIKRILKRLFVIVFALITFGTPAHANTPLRLLVLGDSLAAGYGLPQEATFPSQLEAALRAKGRDVTVINAGVSGDTTSGGLARLEWVLASTPTHVLVELGANDMLRAVLPSLTLHNLDKIVKNLKAKNIKVMLAGMYAAPNLGQVYTDAFRSVYTDLSKKHGIMLYPFFLEGVAAKRDLNQDDGIHPNERGVTVIVGRILPSIEKFLDEKE